MDKAIEKELSIEDKLRMLYELQKLHSEVDKIQTLRGELPKEVQDLEDELAGLETRISNYKSEIDGYNEAINVKNNEIKEAENKIKKYQKDQEKVRNNREFEAINKEIEYQELEIELYNKRINEYKIKLAEKEKAIQKAEDVQADRRKDLDHKRGELDAIIEETQKDETELYDKIAELEAANEERLVKAYKRIRKSFRNGLGIVPVKRGACGGCFNRIPPQRELDVQSHKKVIVCEHCGRILVDERIDQVE